VTPELKPAFTKGNRYLFDPSAYAWNIPSGTRSFALIENFTKSKP
jgi:hypothetical protein